MPEIFREPAIDNYPLDPVPESRRVAWPVLAVVWAGFFLAVPNYIAGGILAENLGWRGSVLAIGHGYLLLGFFAVPLGFVARSTGHSFSFSTRFAFGAGGSRILSVLFALSFIGWASIGISLSAQAVSLVLPLGYTGLCLLFTALFARVALGGFRGLVRLSFVSVPAILALSLFGLSRVLWLPGASLAEMAARVPSGELGLGGGVSVVVGTWLAAVAASPDIQRFALRRRDVVISVLLSLVLLGSLQTASGVLMALAAGTPSLPRVLVGLGLGIPGAILLVFLSWSSADNQIYAAGLGIANALQTRRRFWPGLLSILLAGGLALLRFDLLVTDYLQILSIVFAPVGAIVVADYLLAHAGIIDHDPGRPGIRWKGMGAFGVGVAAGFWVPFPMPFLVSGTVAWLLYGLWILGTPREHRTRQTRADPDRLPPRQDPAPGEDSSVGG